jgi:hypothetical protein
VVTLPGYTTASFDELAHREFSTGCAAALTIPRDKIYITGVSSGVSHQAAPGAPPGPADTRRRLLDAPPPAASEGESGSLVVHFSVKTDSIAAVALQARLADSIMSEDFSDSLLDAGMHITGFVMMALSMGEPTAAIPDATDAAEGLPGFVSFPEPVCAHCVVEEPLISLKYDLWWLVSGGAGFLMLLALAHWACKRHCRRVRRPASTPLDIEKIEAFKLADIEEEMQLDTFHFHVEKKRCAIM